MARGSRILFVMLVAATASMQLPVAHAALPLLLPACGVPVTSSFRLSGDLTGCVGDGIVVGAPNLTIDLNGHRVEGDGSTGDGIANSAGHAKLTVRGGTVRFFADGFFAGAAATDNKLINLVFSLNANDGLEFDGGSGHVIKGVTATGNDDEGIELDGPIPGSTVTNSVAAGNNQRGFDLDISESRVAGNHASGNGLDGFEIEGDNNKVAGNRADGNADCGIDVQGNSNVLKANKTSGNEDDGICITLGDGNTLKVNIAHGNGYPLQASDGSGLGIDAAADVTVSGSGNKARGNDNPLECTGVAC